MNKLALAIEMYPHGAEPPPSYSCYIYGNRAEQAVIMLRWKQHNSRRRAFGDEIFERFPESEQELAEIIQAESDRRDRAKRIPIKDHTPEPVGMNGPGDFYESGVAPYGSMDPSEDGL